MQVTRDQLCFGLGEEKRWVNRVKHSALRVVVLVIVGIALKTFCVPLFPLFVAGSASFALTRFGLWVWGGADSPLRRKAFHLATQHPMARLLTSLFLTFVATGSVALGLGIGLFQGSFSALTIEAFQCRQEQYA